MWYYFLACTPVSILQRHTAADYRTTVTCQKSQHWLTPQYSYMVKSLHISGLCLVNTGQIVLYM